MEKKARGNDVCNIAVGTVINGDMTLEAHLRLEGKIHGNVSSNGRIVMSATALIEGDIKCKDLIIEGILTGNVNAENQVHIHSTAEIKGDIHCGRIHIDNGAIFNGQCTTTLTRGAK